MKRLFFLSVLAIAVSATLAGTALTVFAGPLEDYIRVVGGGSQPIDPTPFTVDIEVFTDEQTFCAYQHVLSYDPTKVQVDSVTLQESGNVAYFCNSMIDNVAGTVTSTCARLGCPPGAFSGTDHVQMHCVAAGGTPLVLVPGSTLMRDNLNQPIAISRYDGSVTCQTPLPAGGVMELPADQSGSPDGLSVYYIALAGAAAAIVLATGAWYVGRRWLS
jgi:hypothetical protein